VEIRSDVDQTVVLHDGRIATVGPAADVRIPAGADMLDATDRFLAPGVTDMHVHLYTKVATYSHISPTA